MTDRELLDNFIQTRSHDAFAALVQRHIGLVYNAARRQLPRDPAMIDDVCQAVFIVLARRAGSLTSDVILPGWLIRTAHLTARDALKLARRRRLHEQRYAAMSAMNQSTSAVESEDAFARELSPHVDRALAHLSDSDRAAIVLRYLQGQSMDEVAATFNVSMETATKRVQRATARLRNYFARHPITPSVAALTAAMQQMPQAAPSPALVQAASATATTGSAAAGGVTTSSLLARGTMKMIFWSNAKAAAAAAAAVMLAISATVGTVSLVRAQAAGGGGGGIVIAPAPSQSPAATPAPEPTTAPAQAGGPLVAHLSNGVSVELIGLTEYPGDNNPWWQADGSPLPTPPQLPGNMMGAMVGPDLMRRVAVHINTRVTGTIEPATVQWALGDRGGADFSFPMMPGRRNPAAQFRIFQVKDTHPTTLRANIASGAWTTVMSSDAQGKTQTIGPDTYIVGKAIDSTGRGARNGTQFEFTQPVKSGGDARRVIVIDTGGAAHDVMVRQMGDNGKTQAFVYDVPVAPAKVKEFQVQTRPFEQWIEFRNVCIDPKQHTDVTIATSDDAQGL